MGKEGIFATVFSLTNNLVYYEYSRGISSVL